jgi:hypothetical protein
MLTRMARSIAFCWLFAFAAAVPAAAQITIDIVRPSAGSVPLSPLDILVHITSAPEITSVQAAIGTRTTTLTRLLGDAWQGSMSLEGLPLGQTQLVVTATNAAAQTGQATRSFHHDRPFFVVTAPTGNVFATPDVRVTARCPDAPQCLIRVSVQYENTPISFPLAAGIGSIDTIVTPPDGVGTLWITANGQYEVARPIVVQSKPNYHAVASYPGRILDITADRALIVDETVVPRIVRLVDRTTNTSQVVWMGRGLNTYVLDVVRSGHLTPSGALIASVESEFGNAGKEFLHEWRDGTVTQLAQLGSVLVNGPFAVYRAAISGEKTQRNLITGVNTVVAIDNAAGVEAMTPDGRIFYSQMMGDATRQIFRWDAGPPPVTTQLTFNAPASSQSTRTDGVNMLYLKVPGPLPPAAALILRTGDGTETVLVEKNPGLSFRIANGWAAFVKGVSGFPVQVPQEVWRCAPDGTQQQLFAALTTVEIEALSDDGEVIFFTSDSTGKTRYLAGPSGTIVNLGEPTGRPIQLDGEWYVAAGNQLLSIGEVGGPARSILSEGATGTFFTTDVAILNPHNSAVPVTIRYLRENASALQQTRTLPAMSRTTIHTDDIPGLEATSVSTVVEAPASSPVVVERLMTWDATGYGGHLGTAVDRAHPRWLFAEGAQGFFSTFFLLANSGADEASVTVTFLVEQGSPVTYTTKVAPGTRKTVFAGDVAGLVNTSFATVIESNVPIVAERAMYFGDSPFWLGGHGSAGVPEPANRWFHAEGATGPLFDTFILLANPHPVDVPVTVSYTTDAGLVFERPHTLRASSRLTINIEDEAPELANVSVSTRVTSTTYPIVSERAMYWGTTGSGWREAHNSFGVTESGLKWGLAEGRAGGPRGYQTYVLVSNSSFLTAELRATFVKEDGTTVVRTFSVPGNIRRSISTSDIPELANANFSTIVESTNGIPFNVESAIYWNANGVIWEGGGNTVGTRLQ